MKPNENSLVPVIVLFMALIAVLGYTARRAIDSYAYQAKEDLSVLKNDPQKLEEFYQKTRAEQKKAAEEKANKANEALKAFDKTEPIKVTSNTPKNRYTSFNLARA